MGPAAYSRCGDFYVQEALRLSGSITYGGHDFGAYTTAEVVCDRFVAASADTLDVVGAAGEVLLGAAPGTRRVNVRLRMLAPDVVGPGVSLASALETMAGWFSPCGSKVLVLPDGCAYRDAVCVDAGAWKDLAYGGTCEVEFCCYDPLRDGAEIVVSGDEVGEFVVGGSVRVAPVVTVVASAGAETVEVGIVDGGFVRVLGGFDGGEVVVADCGTGAVSVDGVDAASRVDVESDYFWLEPGTVRMYSSGALSVSVSYTEKLL